MPPSRVKQPRQTPPAPTCAPVLLPDPGSERRLISPARAASRTNTHATEDVMRAKRRRAAGTPSPEGPKTGGLLRELALVAGAALLYGGVRAVTERSVAEARMNGERILDLE